MKKFWEKHDLFKLAGIMVLITVLLTWVIPQGYWSNSEMVIGDITRVGIFDFFTYGLLGMYYFTVLVTFLFVLGGFYQVLSKAGGYQKLTDSIAKKFNGKEILFVLIVSLIIALLTAVMNDYFVVIAFIPFIVTIMAKMKLDKLTGFVATFGAILVGIIGTIYSSKIVGISVSTFGIEHGTYLWVKWVLFAASFVIFNLFTVLHMKKALKDKKAVAIEELFVSETTTKKTKVWPVAVILSIFVVVGILAYMPWDTAFNITWFADATTWIKEVEIFGAKVFAYILGTFEAFGKWDVFGIQVLMLITALIVKWVYKIKNEEFFTAFGEGFKKTGKLVILLLTTYVVLEFAVMFPVLPTIIDFIMGIISKFNVVLGTIAGLITSLFTVEYQYTANLIGAYFVGSYADFAKQIPIMLQATYGLASFFTPASAILLMGLSYLGISYKDWFKYIWKFLVAMFVIIIILMLIIFKVSA